MSLSIKAAQVRRRPGVASRRMGDPGLGSFLRGVGQTIVGGLTGGPVGAISAAAGAISGGQSRSTGFPVVRTDTGARGPGMSSLGGAITGLVASTRARIAAPPPIQQVPVPGARGAIERFLPGGATGMMSCPSGHHPNKSSYFLRDGTFIAAGTKCVKNRRRNPLNPRALRRSVARIDGAKAWQSKLGEIATKKYTASGKKRASC